MRSLSLIIIILSTAFIGYQFIDSPHGSELKVGCEVCHSPKGWTIDEAYYSFDHNTTRLPLRGEHTQVNCRECHPSLVFSEAGTECMDCHDDIHSNSLGMECERCHTPHSWLVANITEIHQMGRFPLVGAHAMADCEECHMSENFLNFEPIGVTCFDCHQTDYLATTAPNHTLAAYSHDCDECHNIYSYQWGADGFSHAFFPLTLGHTVHDCAECHQSEDYSNVSAECVTCHNDDYNLTTRPNHVQVEMNTDCAICHTTNPGWNPALFPNHNEYYQLNGAHIPLLGDCFACHNEDYTNTPNTCIGCHQLDYNQTTNPNHLEADFSNECLDCHNENAWEPAIFDHSEYYTFTGAHVLIANNCLDCHEDGYPNTPNTCIGCHSEDYDNSANPPHSDSQFSTDCESCHTTNAWNPALFDHSEYYVFTGAHIQIANNCLECHQNGYQNTPSTCYGCHQDDYNLTTDPPHLNSQFSTDCEACHTTIAWEPATFNHDADYFPIYNGEHEGEWNSCSDCHTVSGNYAIFSCIDCHEHNQNDMDDEHDDVTGYVYSSPACLDCHPDGTEPDKILFKR